MVLGATLPRRAVRAPATCVRVRPRGGARTRSPGAELVDAPMRAVGQRPLRSAQVVVGTKRPAPVRGGVRCSEGGRAVARAGRRQRAGRGPRPPKALEGVPSGDAVEGWATAGSAASSPHEAQPSRTLRQRPPPAPGGAPSWDAAEGWATAGSAGSSPHEVAVRQERARSRPWGRCREAGWPLARRSRLEQRPGSPGGVSTASDAGQAPARRSRWAWREGWAPFPRVVRACAAL